MLPLLPALILLILQGPANVERMAWDGRLPGALNALHRQMGGPNQGFRGNDEVVLASLLAVSGDHQMSQALLQILALVQEPTPEQPRSCQVEVAPRVPIPPSLDSPQDGYLTCRRTRDGPF